MTHTVPTARTGRIVAVLASAGIVAAVMQTLVVPLLGELPTLFDTSASNASWVVTATLLAAAVATPTAGRLGDMFGKRRMLLISMIPLIAGSVICALSPFILPLIAGRTLQGIGMGVVPLGISLMRDVVPAEKLGSSIAVMSASLGVGGALGLPFAAAVAQNGSWQTLFWVAAGLSGVVAALVWAFVPAGRVPTTRSRFDFLGAIGLGAALVCLLLAVTKGSGWGWTSGTTLNLLAATALLLPAWGWWELRTTDPLVDLRVTGRPKVLLTNIASLLVGFAMYAQSLVLPQLLQLPTATGYGLGQTMIQMGLWMLPSGLMMMAISPLGAKLSAAKSPKITLTLGALIIGTGYAVSPLLFGSTWGVLIVTLICSSGVGLAYGAMPNLIMSAVPTSETASANSFNTLMRSIGSSFAAAVIGVTLANMTTDFGGHQLPSDAGFTVAMIIGAVVALLAAVVAAVIPMRQRLTGGRHRATFAEKDARPFGERAEVEGTAAPAHA